MNVSRRKKRRKEGRKEGRKARKETFFDSEKKIKEKE